MPQLPQIQYYIFTTPATVMRASTVASIYGPKYDWSHPVTTDVTGSILIYPLGATETGSAAESQFQSTHFHFMALPTVDIIATDRVQFDLGNGTILTEVDGDPFVWRDSAAQVHHIEGKLKIFTGVS